MLGHSKVRAFSPTWNILVKSIIIVRSSCTKLPSMQEIMGSKPMDFQERLSGEA
jgi:hypothetical protein